MQGLDQLIKAAGELSNADAKVATLKQQAEEIEKENAKRAKDAQSKAKKIISEADAEAKAALFQIRKTEEALAKREKEVVTRENAVKWIDDETKNLTEAQKELKTLKADLKKATAEANGAKDKWITRQAELNAQSEALVELSGKLAKKAPKEVKAIMHPKKKETNKASKEK